MLKRERKGTSVKEGPHAAFKHALVARMILGIPRDAVTCSPPSGEPQLPVTFGVFGS